MTPAPDAGAAGSRDAEAPGRSARPTLKLALPRMNGPAVYELQTLLVKHGREEVGTPDRVFGRNTGRAVCAFQQQKGLKDDGIVGADTWRALLAAPSNPPAVPPGSPYISMPRGRTIEAVRASGYDFSTRNGTIAAIKQECGAQGLSLKEQVAYVLATIEHETGKKFEPVKEAYYLGARAENYRQTNKVIQRYYPYYGRGYIQLTHDYNYRYYKGLLKVDLLERPDRVCEPAIALFIAIHGLRWGIFTKKQLSKYINGQGCDFRQARRCVNGMDKAEHIAGIAQTYLNKLKSGAV